MVPPGVTEVQVMAAIQAAAAVVLELDPATVVRERRLVDDLGADSLALAGMLDLIEERLAPLAGRPVRIDDAAAHELATVGELADHALALVSGPG